MIRGGYDMSKNFKFFLEYLKPRIIKNLYLMLKYGCVIHPQANLLFTKNIKFGRGCIIGKCDIIAQGKIIIGRNCLINDYVILNSKTGYITIGDNVNINHYTIIHGNGGVEIGDNTIIASFVGILKNHAINKYYQDYTPVSEKKTIIGKYVWVCSSCVIIDGVEIGDNAIVAANSFVNKNVEATYIYGGNPARPITKRPNN
jgi:acetyltransferase-like isoleucine patch superfamily enzyme